MADWSGGSNITELSAVATTRRKYGQAAQELAEAAARRAGIPCVPRERLSIPALREKYGVENVLIAHSDELRLATPTGEFFFHPNMAHLRLKNIRQGDGDRMSEVMQLRSGLRVLDCTLGIGADAIVESYGVGESGLVVALEASPLIEAVVSYGLAHHVGERADTTAAMRRIQTVCTQAIDYLRAQPDDSFDIVYFDPMFRHPLLASEALNPLRSVADHEASTEAMVAEACRVARQRVVFKENARSHEFARLGFTVAPGSKYSKISYGVIEC